MTREKMQHYTGVFGKITVLVILAGMIYVTYMGVSYRHSSVAHIFFGKAAVTESESLFFAPESVGVVAESVIAERQADGACGCPYCCSAAS